MSAFDQSVYCAGGMPWNATAAPKPGTLQAKSSAPAPPMQKPVTPTRPLVRGCASRHAFAPAISSSATGHFGSVMSRCAVPASVAIWPS